MLHQRMLLVLIPLLLLAHFSSCYRGEEKHDIGTLAGDVQNWAMLIQNYIMQVRRSSFSWHQELYVVYRWTYMSSTGLVHKCLSIYILLILNYLHYVFSAACQWWHQPSHNTEPFRSSHLQRWEKKWHRACWASERRPCWLFSQQKESSRGDYHNNNFEFIMKAAKTICNTVFLLS